MKSSQNVIEKAKAKKRADNSAIYGKQTFRGTRLEGIAVDEVKQTASDVISIQF